MLRHSTLTVLSMICLFACSRAPQTPAISQSGSVVSTAADPRPVILAFGDSLTAGHGVELKESYPSQLQRLLDQRGYKYHVVNAGVSGDTTGGGVSRIDAALQFQPKVVVLELGGNDGLRGLPLRQAEGNLERMIVKFQNAGTVVVLAGMTLPRNLGPDYIHEFESIFSDLSAKHKTILIPFFLEGVAARADLNQDDGIHPTARGYTIVADTVFRYVEPILDKS